MAPAPLRSRLRSADGPKLANPLRARYLAAHAGSRALGRVRKDVVRDDVFAPARMAERKAGNHRMRRGNADFAVAPLSRDTRAASIVDFKPTTLRDLEMLRRNNDPIPFGHRVWPFGGKAVGRLSIGMTTQSVFGAAAADGRDDPTAEGISTVTPGRSGAGM